MSLGWFDKPLSCNLATAVMCEHFPETTSPPSLRLQRRFVGATMQQLPATFEDQAIRRAFDEATET